MGIYSKVKETYASIARITFIVIGVVMVIVGAILNLNRNSLNKDTVDVLGTVVKVYQAPVTGKDGSVSIKQSVDVQYAVGKEQRISKLEDYEGEVKERQTIRIYYNKNDPSEISTKKNESIAGVVLIIFGALIAAIAYFIKKPLKADANMEIRM